MSQPTAAELNGTPYRVVVAENPCEHCKRGEQWAIVGPDDVELGRIFDDEADADEYVDQLNHAYFVGRRSGLEENAGPVDRLAEKQRTVRSTIQSLGDSGWLDPGEVMQLLNSLPEPREVQS